MCAAFSDDDVGKTVVNASGEEVGMVTAVEHGTARVKPDPGITDSIKATLGWEDTSEDTYPLQEDAIERITGNEIQLSGDVHEGSTSGTLESNRTGTGDTIAGSDTDRSTAGPADDTTRGHDETGLDESDRGRGDESSSLDDADRTGSGDARQLTGSDAGTELGDDSGPGGREESAVPDRDVDGRGEGFRDSDESDDRPMDEPRGDESGLMDADRDDRTDRTPGSRGGTQEDEAMDPDVGDGDRVGDSDDVTSEDRDRRSRDEDADDSSTV